MRKLINSVLVILTLVVACYYGVDFRAKARAIENSQGPLALAIADSLLGLFEDQMEILSLDAQNSETIAMAAEKAALEVKRVKNQLGIGSWTFRSMETGLIELAFTARYYPEEMKTQRSVVLNLVDLHYFHRDVADIVFERNVTGSFYYTYKICGALFWTYAVLGVVLLLLRGIWWFIKMVIRKPDIARAISA